MAWLEVNSHLDNSYGYFHGYGHDDGWFCFQRGEEDWIVANSFEPYLKDTPYGNFYVEPYTYNENPVLRNTGKNMYVFKSKSPVRGSGWIMFDRLQEPMSYLDIDLSTLIGDGWYELRGTPSFELTSMSNNIIAYGAGIYEDNPQITMKNEFQCYEYQPHRGSWFEPSDEMPYGRYESEDGDWKIVGNPVWKTWSNDSAVTNLPVNYIGRDENENKVFRVGSMTLQKNADANVLTIGTLSAGRWYEGQQYPNPDTTADVKFAAYEIQDGTKTAIPSGDIEIEYSHTGRGEMSAFCYMGEVAQWH